MFTRVRQLVRLWPGRNLVLVFTLTVLLPGLVLAIVGVRALVQERQLADQQVRERLDRVAGLAAQRVTTEVRAWQTTLEAVNRAGAIDAGALPTWMREAVGKPGVAALLLSADGPAPFIVWPPRAAAFQPWPESPAENAPSPALAEAETAELRDKDYPRATSLYRQLLAGARPDERARLLHRLARVDQKAGRWDAALRTLRALTSRTNDRIGVLPADLVARYEILAHDAAQGPSARLAADAADFYRDLVGGTWLIDKSRYLYYVQTAREWAGAESASSDAFVGLAAADDGKRALADALANGTSTGAYVAVGRMDDIGGVKRRVMLAVATSWLAVHRWPDVLAAVAAEDLDVTLIASNGDALFGPAHDGPAALADPTPTGSRPVQAGDVSWRVDVRPSHPEALSADLARRRNVYVVMVAAVLALMGCGTYLTIRVVRREIEIARMKSDFVSAVSHEFRSPLTGIRQLGEMLMRGRVPTDARRQEYYERITNESNRLARVVENLLDFSRMEEGRQQYQFQPMDAGAWLRDVVDSFETQISQNGHHVVANIPPDLPQIVADREALTTAVDNLLDNAVKYSPASETVWLDADAHEDGLIIRVRDRGIGIAPADRPHVFERFYRGTDEAAREVKGTGLGLSLVAHIIRAHGGRVEFDSQPGEGTTFSVHLNTVGPRTSNFEVRTSNSR